MNSYLIRYVIYAVVDIVKLPIVVVYEWEVINEILGEYHI